MAGDVTVGNINANTLNGVAPVKLSGDEIVQRDGEHIKNQCTAWADIDFTTTPPTIATGSFGVYDAVTAGGGYWDIYITDFDNTKAYTAHASLRDSNSRNTQYDWRQGITADSIRLFVVTDSGTAQVAQKWKVTVMGGK